MCFSSPKRHNLLGFHNLSYVMTVLLTIVSVTIIGAQTQQSESLLPSKSIDETEKVSDLLPTRERRFWSIFDWEDSREKPMSRFLPMRGRKAGFLPMRGKKFSSQQMSGPYIYGQPNDYYIPNTFADYLDSIANSRPQITSKAKKAFHAMRGKKLLNNQENELATLYGLDNIDNIDDINSEMLKRSRNFFGMRG